MRQPTLTGNVEDSKSKLLGVLVQKIDFKDDIVWSNERVDQSYEIPSVDNHGLIESSYRGLVGTTDNNQLIGVAHNVYKYESAADSNETINLLPQEGEHSFEVIFPDLGENTQSKCYIDNSFLTCEIIVQYTTLVSKLRVLLPREYLENNRVPFVDYLLQIIDERITKIE
jgi:hypothetical protein